MSKREALVKQSDKFIYCCGATGGTEVYPTVEQETILGAYVKYATQTVFVNTIVRDR